MLKYFNENISLALQERYRDLHEFRKTEAVEEGSPREAKVPKIAEEGEQVGGEGAFEASAPPPFPRLLEQPKEEDNFVASWLQNSFKMTAADTSEAAAGGSALDLRAAPLSLHIPALQQDQRFKMQDFWSRSRPSSPAQEQEPGPAPTPQPPATPDHKIITEKLVNEIQVSFFIFKGSRTGSGNVLSFCRERFVYFWNTVEKKENLNSKCRLSCHSTLGVLFCYEIGTMSDDEYFKFYFFNALFSGV